MLGSRRGFFQPLTQGLGQIALRMGLTPNQVTWASLVIASGGAVIVAMGHLIVGALVILLGASMDFVDGALARLSGKVTRSGGYLDSLLDRFVDFVVLLGILVHFDRVGGADAGWQVDTTWVWAVGFVALFGSITTSFAKARVYQDHRPDASVWSRDLLERAERYFLIIPGIFFQGIIDAVSGGGGGAGGAGGTGGFSLLFWVIVALAVLSMVTVVQRMRVAMRVLGDLDRGA